MLIVSDRLSRNSTHANDGIHRGADLMAHAGQEIRLGRIGLLCGGKGRQLTPPSAAVPDG